MFTVGRAIPSTAIGQWHEFARYASSRICIADNRCGRGHTYNKNLLPCIFLFYMAFSCWFEGCSSIMHEGIHSHDIVMSTRTCWHSYEFQEYLIRIFLRFGEQEGASCSICSWSWFCTLYTNYIVSSLQSIEVATSDHYS